MQASKAIERALEELSKKKRKTDNYEWRGNHMDVYAEKELRWGSLQPHADDQASAWWLCIRERERDVLSICLALHPKDWSDYQVGRLSGRDISQSAKRRVGFSLRQLEDGSSQSVTSTVMPAWRCWLATPFNRLVVGEESLSLQGFPTVLHSDLMQSTSDDLLSSLGGNAMSGGVLCAV